MVETQLAGAVAHQEQKPTGDGHVLHEHDELYLIAELAVKDERRDERETRE